MGEREGIKVMYRCCSASGDRQERRKGNSYGSLSFERRAEPAELHEEFVEITLGTRNSGKIAYMVLG